MPSDLTLKAQFPEDTGRTNGGTKAVRDPKAVDFFIGNIEKAVAKAQVWLQAAQQRQKRYADVHEHRIEVQYEVGQLVWLDSKHVTIKAVGSRKMLPRWLRPFKILVKTIASPVNYTLDIYMYTP